MQHLPNTPSLASASSQTLALCIEHVVTADMDDGQQLPPLIEDGFRWHVVHRAKGSTLWRRVFLSSSPVIDWRAAPGGQTRSAVRKG